MKNNTIFSKMGNKKIIPRGNKNRVKLKNLKRKPC